MMAYWDWWVGALALGSITFFITCLLGADSVSLVHGNESSIGKLHAKPNEATRRSRQHPTTSKRRSWQQRNLNSALAGAASPFRRPPDQAVESTRPPQTRLPMTANATLWSRSCSVLLAPPSSTDVSRSLATWDQRSLTSSSTDPCYGRTCS